VAAAAGRDQGHRVQLVRVPVQGPVRAHNTTTGVSTENARMYLVAVRIRPDDPDPEAVRAALRALAEQGVVRATRTVSGQEMFVLTGGPDIAAEVHRALDGLPGWTAPESPPSPPPTGLPSLPPPDWRG
jgi:hypothetical protein